MKCVIVLLQVLYEVCHFAICRYYMKCVIVLLQVLYEVCHSPLINSSHDERLNFLNTKLVYSEP
jgi:hypothetical protein